MKKLDRNQVAARVAAAEPLETAGRGGAGDERDHVRFDPGDAGTESAGEFDADAAAFQQFLGVKRAQRQPRHAVGGGDRRTGMPGELDRVQIAEFDDAVVAGAEQGRQRIAQADRRDGVEEGRISHQSRLTKSMTMAPGSRCRYSMSTLAP